MENDKSHILYISFSSSATLHPARLGNYSVLLTYENRLGCRYIIIVKKSQVGNKTLTMLHILENNVFIEGKHKQIVRGILWD